MRFEWDEEKNRANVKKHGIDFRTALRVFSDERRIDIYDEKHSLDEDRYLVIGMVNEILTILAVSYTERGEKTRLISARLADKEECDKYYVGER